MTNKNASPEKRIGEEKVTGLKYTPPKDEEKKKAYLVAMSLIQKAGARHSLRDVSLLQQIHDMVCELGAKCPDNKKAAESVLNGNE